MENTIQNDLSQKYSKGTILIHWLTVLLIVLLFPLGKYMTSLAPLEKMDLIKLHAILGCILLILTIIRSWLFFKAARPTDLKTGSKFTDKLAIWIHNAFYFLLFGITISGIATMILGGYGNALSTGNPELIQHKDEVAPLKGHGLMAMVLIFLVIIHVIGVLKHYLLTKENTLKRLS